MPSKTGLYYLLKPILPWRLRMALRRVSARRIRAHSTATWPIDERAGRPPAGWPGWPGHLPFAFVLTHDVESAAGLARCQRLAELEMALGFRSSFNFIPENGYSVPPELRDWLAAQGFEVAVHDLEHDGRLFASARGFERKAARINRYLREWGSVGFRAGFMLRNLRWLHRLEIAYDSSTFDTDPFELQPRGAGTVFPIWIRAPAGGPDDGYVELPYTLPQDSTLFLVLRESTPELWFRKLAWIARKGGMALLDVHPDYVRFPDEPASPRTYPVSHYIDFLRHLRERYAGRYWQPLPRQLAACVRDFSPRPAPPRPRRIAMITHSHYESDSRVIRYAETLVRRGDTVDVLALRRSPELPRQELVGGVNVCRIQARFSKSTQSRLAYAWPLLRFLCASSWHLSRRHLRERYDLVHVHNLPDFLVFAAWLPRLAGTPVILDIHDLVPEFYGSKFAAQGGRRQLAVLHWIERRAARFADHVIVSNHLWLEKFAARTGTREKCSVFINHVDNATFHRGLRTRHDERQIVLFPGGLQWHQGVDLALQAFKLVAAELPHAEFHIYGDGNMAPALKELAGRIGLNGRVSFFPPVSATRIAAIMANADVGVVPKRADSFGNEAYSTKIMEFMSLGVPVVVSRTQIDQYYFDDSVVRFFESGNVAELAQAIVEVLRDANLRQRLTERALGYAQRHGWASRKSEYLQLVDRLAGAAAPSDAP